MDYGVQLLWLKWFASKPYASHYGYVEFCRNLNDEVRDKLDAMRNSISD